ncbi:flagellin [Asticcacaulis sp. LKC15W]|uniref:Flagellin n=2 Tax=Asticcacaulis machinosus TaxID=2984211 RepID=A0ABT5HEM6_9CAUL|nr:flagellin [Asticcacaulis machinosus]
MPGMSILTNRAALTALQNLNATAAELAVTQRRISTGLKVASAKDNGAVWAIANYQRSQISSIDVLQTSLNRGKSVIDVAMAAGESISDIFTLMKEKALAASDTSIDTTARAALSEEFMTLAKQVDRISRTSSFNGTSLIGAGNQNISVLAGLGGDTMTIRAQDMSLAGLWGSVPGHGAVTLGPITTAADAQKFIDATNWAIKNTNLSLAKLGTDSKMLDRQSTMLYKIQDAMEAGVGNLVDADMAKESVKLQALQTKMQLGILALSMANKSSQMILELFRR